MGCVVVDDRAIVGVVLVVDLDLKTDLAGRMAYLVVMRVYSRGC